MEFLANITAQIATKNERKKAKKHTSKRVINARQKVNVLNIGANSIVKNV